ncbi:uncharacterized protein LY89DRAFT_753405 [Mollisia scopiformis]|uniref:Uncharacterized protein n=1 Tax=Mollisia scopiformis TaxID=149040 RepID=A0A194X1A7_MOLSC|nr:uncharacterized protein LY89DRAFT_753405 [Mollisia scopiformis]KUJ13981.1 hypothetical protein LY89DRAFT_753405 [Mollisia scopiformis]
MSSSKTSNARSMGANISDNLPAQLQPDAQLQPSTNARSLSTDRNSMQPQQELDQTPPPSYKPGDIAWLLTWVPGSEPVLRIGQGHLEREAHNHSVLILRHRWSSVTRTYRYEGLLMTTFGYKSPEDYIRLRSIRVDDRESTPLIKRSCPVKWPTFTSARGAVLPVLRATRGSDTGKDQSYVKLDVHIDIPASQLRLFHVDKPRLNHPRLAFQSFSALVKYLGLMADPHELYHGIQKQVPAVPLQDPPPQATRGLALGPTAALNASVAALPLQAQVEPTSNGDIVAQAPVVQASNLKPTLLRAIYPWSPSPSDQQLPFNLIRINVFEGSEPSAPLLSDIMGIVQTEVFASLNLKSYASWVNFAFPDDSDIYPEQKAATFWRKVNGLQSIRDIVAIAQQSLVISVIEPVQAAGNWGWFVRTDAMSNWIRQRIASEVLGRRAMENIVACPSMVVMAVGNCVTFVIVLEH